MRKNKVNYLIACILLGSLFLAACSDKESSKKNDENTPEKQEQNNQTDTNADTDTTEPTDQEETTVQESLPPIKEAEDIPAEEKKALLAVMDEYIKAFNNKDIDTYMKTISKNPTSFKIDEEKAYIKKIFDTMNIKMEPKNIVIIKYKENQADIFTEMNTKVSESGSKKVVDKMSRQVNTLSKEDGQWKITSTFAMETE